jgi:DNA-binding GntR family transcriptional regulator
VEEVSTIQDVPAQDVPSPLGSRIRAELERMIVDGTLAPLDSYALNGLLFGFGCEQLAAAITAAQALELRSVCEAMDAAVLAMDREGFFTLNVRFHERIMAFSRNRQVEAAYLAHTRKLALFRRRSFDRDSSLTESHIEHRRILDALLAGDGDLARRCAEEHTRSGRARFLSSIQTSALPGDGS